MLWITVRHSVHISDYTTYTHIHTATSDNCVNFNVYSGIEMSKAASSSSSGKGLKTGTGKATVSVGKTSSTTTPPKTSRPPATGKSTSGGGSSSSTGTSTQPSTANKGTSPSGRSSQAQSYQNGPIVGQQGHSEGRDGIQQFLLPEGASYYIVPCSQPLASKLEQVLYWFV